MCVDVSDEVYEYVNGISDRPVFRITKLTNPYIMSMDRLELAKIYLYIYHNASAVITTNLHTAFPCLAFNVPVCLIDQEKRDGRFDGPEEFTNHCTCSKFLEGKYYDVNNPPNNPQEFIAFRDTLTETCMNFTGYDSGIPTLEDNYRPDIIRIVQMMANNINGCKKSVFDLSGRHILKVAAVKFWHKIFRPSVRYVSAYERYYYDKYLG